MMRRILFVSTLIALLSACSAREPGPVGVGSGTDDYKISPCACIPIENSRPSFRDMIELTQVRHV